MPLILSLVQRYPLALVQPSHKHTTQTFGPSLSILLGISSSVAPMTIPRDSGPGNALGMHRPYSLGEERSLQKWVIQEARTKMTRMICLDSDRALEVLQAGGEEKTSMDSPEIGEISKVLVQMKISFQEFQVWLLNRLLD